MLAWLGGIALQLQQPVLWPWQGNAAMVTAGAVGVVTSAMAAWRHHGRLGHWLLCAALAGLAFGITAWRAESRLAQRLAPDLEGRDLMVSGVVERLPQVTPDGQRFIAIVSGADQPANPATVILNWRAGLDSR